MKARVVKLLLTSLILGIVITWAFTAQMNWSPQMNCKDQNSPSSINIKRVDCAGLEYGYPLRFMKAESTVYQTFIDKTSSRSVFLGISSSIKFNQIKLLGNIAIWSIISLLILLVILRNYSANKKPSKKFKATEDS